MKTYTIIFDFGKCSIKTTRKEFLVTQELAFYLSGNSYTYFTKFAIIDNKSKLLNQYNYKSKKNELNEHYIYSYTLYNFSFGKIERINPHNLHKYLSVTELEKSLEKVGFNIVEVKIK